MTKTHRDNRKLFVFAPSAADPAYVTQKRFLEEADEGLVERDLVVLKIPGEDTELRQRFKVPVERFSVVLVGKDGREKARYIEPVQSTELFTLIDSMPMRQREIDDKQQ